MHFDAKAKTWKHFVGDSLCSNFIHINKISMVCIYYIANWYYGKINLLVSFSLPDINASYPCIQFDYFITKTLVTINPSTVWILCSLSWLLTIPPDWVWECNCWESVFTTIRLEGGICTVILQPVIVLTFWWVFSDSFSSCLEINSSKLQMSNE